MSSRKICAFAAALAAAALSVSPDALARDGGMDHGNSRAIDRVTSTTQNPSTFTLNKTGATDFRGLINNLKSHEVKHEEAKLLAEYSALRAQAIQAGSGSPLFKTLTAMELQIAAKYRALGGDPALLGPLS
jgi:hypothetical protein